MITSVAMCTYNGGAYLSEQLESIAAQTRMPDEVVVCDDGSTDGTRKELERFRQESPFEVHLYHNPANIGSTANFSQAIGFCRGDVVVLADQDDVWFPDKLQRLTAALEERSEAAFVLSDAHLVDAELRPLGHTLWQAISFGPLQRIELMADDGVQLLLRRRVATGATMAFRAIYRDLLLPIPDNWVHDAWIALVLRAVAACTLVEEPLIQYRQHGRQQIGEKPRTLWEQYLTAKKLGVDWFEKTHDMFSAARDRLRERAADRMSSRVLGELEEKISHAEARVRMRERGLRWPAIFREAIRGRYGRYSLGWKSICQDLFMR